MTATWALVAVCGLAFGFAFGLTGVGSVFAVPLLTYVIGLPPHRAVCVAMVSVSAMSALATVLKSRAAEIEVRAGAIIAAGGVLGAPFGAWLGRFLPGRWLMVIFAIFVVTIAIRLMLEKTEPSLASSSAAASRGTLRWGPLASAGVTVGVAAGLLGVGGVALISPMLVILAHIPIYRAIATSLPVGFVISVSAITSHFLGGQRVPPDVTALFASSGVAGLLAGMQVSKRIAGPRLQMVFAWAILAVAVFILARSLG